MKPAALSPEILALIGALRVREERPGVARTLAGWLGAEDLALFIRDSELGVLLPAIGFPQTLPRGRDWPDFLERCVESGQLTGDLPKIGGGAGDRIAVLGCATGAEAVVVLIGGQPRVGEAAALGLLLPLIAAACQGDLAEVRAAGHAATARDVAQQAQALARALDTARRGLEEALGEAQESERRKDEFLAMLGHELRNPLASVLNAVEILQALGPDTPPLQRNRDVARRQLRQLTRLVDDLLDIARISRGRIELRREVIALGAVVQQALEACRPLVAERRHELTVDLPAEPLWVHGDAVRLTQAVSNLLTNASKFTPPGGRIALCLRRQGEQAAIDVLDTGAGLPADQLERIFEPFTQFHTALDRADSGLGIGLALVRKLVEMHGGTVAAASGGPGQGSTFAVRLPLVAAAPPRQDPPSRPAQQGAGRRILVVDDNLDAVATLAELLEIWGYQVWIATEGGAALRQAVDCRPGVILLDIGLPGMDGYEVVSRLRADPQVESALIIALTGYGQEADRQRALAAGFDHHLTKPVDLDALRELLSRSAERCTSGP